MLVNSCWTIESGWKWALCNETIKFSCLKVYISFNRLYSFCKGLNFQIFFLKSNIFYQTDQTLTDCKGWGIPWCVNANWRMGKVVDLRLREKNNNNQRHPSMHGTYQTIRWDFQVNITLIFLCSMTQAWAIFSNRVLSSSGRSPRAMTITCRDVTGQNSFMVLAFLVVSL